MWGQELKSEQDVWTVFYDFITGKERPNGVKVLFLLLLSTVFQTLRSQVQYAN